MSMSNTRLTQYELLNYTKLFWIAAIADGLIYVLYTW